MKARSHRSARAKSLLRAILIASAIAATLLYWRHWIHEERALKKAEAKALIAKRNAMQGRSRHPWPLPGARLVQTEHYAITTTADETRTQRVARAVEALHGAHAAFFPGHARRDLGDTRLKLTLYAHQAQFKANNYSSSWAEAYYLRPICYAYYAGNESNPYHWMIHEATHQLNAEVAGFPKHKWVDEGLATYFGTSRIEAGRLIPGRIDPDTYPVWHLWNTGLTGNLDRDIASGRWIPIHALITGIDGPSIHSNVNRYYIQYWSLSHFLFHGEGGRHADGYRRLIAEGGTLENFRRHIGPPERIEAAWYRHLLGLIAEHTRHDDDDASTPIVWHED